MKNKGSFCLGPEVRATPVPGLPHEGLQESLPGHSTLCPLYLRPPFGWPVRALPGVSMLPSPSRIFPISPSLPLHVFRAPRPGNNHLPSRSISALLPASCGVSSSCKAAWSLSPLPHSPCPPSPPASGTCVSVALTKQPSPEWVTYPFLRTSRATTFSFSVAVGTWGSVSLETPTFLLLLHKPGCSSTFPDQSLWCSTAHLVIADVGPRAGWAASLWFLPPGDLTDSL